MAFKGRESPQKALINGGEYMNKLLLRLAALEAAEAAQREPVVLLFQNGDGTYIINSGRRKGEIISLKEKANISNNAVVIILE